MKLGKKISLAALSISLVGFGGSYYHAVDLKRRMAEIDKRPDTFEFNYLYSELNGFNNTGYRVIEKYRNQPEEWKYLQKMYDRCKELRIMPSVISDRKEKEFYNTEHERTIELYVLTAILSGISAWFTVCGSKNEKSHQSSSAELKDSFQKA